MAPKSVFWGVIISDTLHRELIYSERSVEDTLSKMFSLFFFSSLSPDTTASGHKAALRLKIMK